MAILEFKYCDECKERTYHRYQNSLRCSFTRRDCWQCVNCIERKAKKPVWRDNDDLDFGQNAL